MVEILSPIPAFLININILPPMKFLTEDRKLSIYRATGVVSALISLFHYAVLGLTVALSQQIDKVNNAPPLDPFPNPFPADITNLTNIPFAVVIGILAFVQLIPSLMMVSLNDQERLSAHLHGCSIAAFLSSFALGVSFAMSIINFNPTVGNQDQYSLIIPTYYIVQVDTTLNFLFCVPMLFYACYQSTEDYIVKPNLRNEGLCLQSLVDNYGWLLGTILINIGIGIAFIANLYQYAGIQDTYQGQVFYGLDAFVDPYTFYFIVQVIFNFVALTIFAIHFRMGVESYLKKKQLIIVTTILTAFQLGGFFFIAVKTPQIYIQYYIDRPNYDTSTCIFNNCQEALVLIEEITTYMAIGLLTSIMLVIYVKAFSSMASGPKAKETLLTQRTADYVS